MKKVRLIFILLIGFGSISYAQTITIGTQVWMTKNLDVATFRNGDPIPQAKTDEEWKKAGENKQPAWCYYDNDPANGAKYGKLYNWYAVNDLRGLAPKGWHIPSDDEWTILTDYLDGEDSVGVKMKSKTGWNGNRNSSNNIICSSNCHCCYGICIKNGKGTDSSDFNGLPGGARSFNGAFSLIGKHGYWWSSTENNTYSARHRGLIYNDGYLYRLDYGKEEGFSVRCLRD